MVTRKELHAFQRQEITFMLANGTKVYVPAMKCIMAILNVLNPEQQSRVLRIVADDANSQIVSGAAINVPDLSHLKGVAHGHTF